MATAKSAKRSANAFHLIPAVHARAPGWLRTLSRMATPAVFTAAHLALFLVLWPNTREDVVLRGFLQLSFHDSGRVLAGAVPYRDFLLEYPPGTLSFMLAPRIFAVGFLSYRTLFFVEAALLDAAIVVTLYAIARSARLPATRVLAFYTIAIVAIGPLTAYRLDLAPAALTVLGVLAWQRNRPALAAAALAAGAATKIYPLLLLPPLIMDQWVQGRARRAPAAILAFAVTLAVFLSPALLAGADGLTRALRFQTERNLQVESIWATPPLLLHLTTGFALHIEAMGRALVILGPGNTLGQAGTPALAIVALVTYWLWWRLRGRSDVRGATLLLGTALLVFAAATLNKVLSPQYMIWAMPSLALLPLRPRLTPVALIAFAASLPLTQWIYPVHYGELVRWVTPLSVAVLALRNLLLVLALAALLAAFWRLGRAPRAGSDKLAGSAR